MSQKAHTKYERLNEDGTINETAPSINEDFVPTKESTRIAKPPSAPIYEIKPRESPLVLNFPGLTEDEIREACLNYASRHCCYGSNFAKKMVICQIHNECVFHYRLDSLGEKRETSQKFFPYRGEVIDGAENGVPPEPWDIPVSKPQGFKNGVHEVEIPHTAFMKPCSRCRATGKVQCTSCKGTGRRACSSCGGSGKPSALATCGSCSGRGYKSCKTCVGSGLLKCPRCHGYKRLKWLTMLIVTWTNHEESFFTDTRKHMEKILLEPGEGLFYEEGPKVSPLSEASDASVNYASAQMIEKHNKEFPFEIILKQRHCLRAVPYTRVEYEWRSKVGEFYVYGLKNDVYFEKYPQSCCCCSCL